MKERVYDAQPHIVERNAYPIRDGVTLMTDVYRPYTDQRIPAMLTRTPYGKAVVRPDHGFLESVRAAETG